MISPSIEIAAPAPAAPVRAELALIEQIRAASSAQAINCPQMARPSHPDPHQAHQADHAPSVSASSGPAANSLFQCPRHNLASHRHIRDISGMEHGSSSITGAVI